MKNTFAKSWADVQLIIGSIAVALTLGLWGLFASREKVVSGVSAEAVIPPQVDPVVVVTPPVLFPGQKLLFAGTVPQTSPQSPPAVTNVKRQGGGGRAVTTTRSSRP